MPLRLGKYRGHVANNVDPLQIGRVLVDCPDALGPGTLAWAMPCVAVAGAHRGDFTVPAVGSNVWVEFEQGDQTKAIYSGGFWDTPFDIPAAPAVPTRRVISTERTQIEMDDVAGSVVVQLKGSHIATSITLDGDGIELVSGIASLRLGQTGVSLTFGAASIALSPTTVSVNHGALEVT